MGNRKQQIENLENEIVRKQQALSELKDAEERQDPETFDPGSYIPSDDLKAEDIADILRNI